jgi:hypothetical protein
MQKMIRVLRIMEYEFDSYEQMEQSMSHNAVPTNGIKIFGRNVIRSTAIINVFEQESETDA